MRYRSLGQSGIQASVVAFGAWAIGGWFWGGADDDQSIKAIHAAIDAGINLIDTAPAYGLGRSEEVIGRALQGRRDKVVLASKCGMVWDTTKGVPFTTPEGHCLVQLGKPIYKYLGPESIRYEIEQSLRRLQTDYIDLYQTHWQEPTTPIEDTMQTLLDLKQEGKIRAIGVCNATCEEIDAYRAVGPLDSDQERYSMLDRALEGQQLPHCERGSMAVLAYSPLAQGLLTGKMDPERQLVPDDWRSLNPRFSAEGRKKILALLEKMRPVAEARGASLGQLAVAWALAQPGLTHALVGTRSAEQLQENAAAGDIELTTDELTALNQILSDYEQAE